MGLVTIYPSNDSVSVSGSYESFTVSEDGATTTITPTFTLPATPLVVVNGQFQNFGWSKVLNSIVFNPGLNKGDVVLIFK